VIYLRRGFRQLRLQFLHESGRRIRQAHSSAKVLQAHLAFFPGQQVLTIVSERLGAYDTDVAGSQFGGELRENADFQLPAVNPIFLAVDWLLEQFLPAI
jgi:hypothetical protein